MSSAASRFLSRERALIHSECPQLSRGALILINVCFVPLPHSLKVHTGEGLGGKKARNALMSKAWWIFLFFNWFIMLVPEHLVSEVCYATLATSHDAIGFFMLPPTVAALQKWQLWQEIQQRPRENLQITSPKDPASKSYQGCTQTWKMKTFTNTPFSIHNKPRTDQLHHYFNIILPGSLSFQGFLKKMMVFQSLCAFGRKLD